MLNIHGFHMTYDFRMIYGSRFGYGNGIFASDPGYAPAFASSTGSTNGCAKAGSREIESTLAGLEWNAPNRIGI